MSNLKTSSPAASYGFFCDWTISPNPYNLPCPINKDKRADEFANLVKQYIKCLEFINPMSHNYV